MQRMNMSEAETKASVRPDAERRLLRSLVLSKFAENEGITVEAADVDAEIENMASQAGEQAEMIRRIFGSDQGRENLARTLLTRRTFARLTALASGETTSSEPKAAEVAAETPEEEKPARRPARSRRSTPKTDE
jgi:trigger factor